MSATTEQIASPRPVIVAERKPKPSGYWDQWFGKQMVFQTKAPILITGTLKEFRNTFLLIEDAEVRGNKYTAKPKQVMLDRNFISHFHEVCELEANAATSEGVHP